MLGDSRGTYDLLCCKAISPGLGCTHYATSICKHFGVFVRVDHNLWNIILERKGFSESQMPHQISHTLYTLLIDYSIEEPYSSFNQECMQ